MEKFFLCLDISTSCIGYCVLEDNDTYFGKIHDIGYVELKNEAEGIENLFLKKKQFIGHLLTNINKFKISNVAIEEPLLGSNNINTVATLLRFNGIISDLMYNAFNVVPTYISSFDARKYAFPELITLRTYNKNGSYRDKKDILKSLSKKEITLFGSYPSDFPKKTILWNKVNENYSYINWDLDKYGNLKKENFDATDALIVGLGTLHQRQFKTLKIEINDVICDDVKASYTMKFWGKEKKVEIMF